MNRLTLLQEKVKKQGKNWLNKYSCSCGNITLATKYNVERDKIKSCGCIKKEVLQERNTTHGLIKEDKRLYTIWKGINARCRNKNHIAYKYYGGKGITISNEWKNYESFYFWAKNNGYEDLLTIDRKDSKGNYEASNCRWTTKEIQAQNTSASVGLDIARKIKTTEGTHEDIAEIYKVHRTTVSRIKNGETYKNLDKTITIELEELKNE